MLCTEFNSKEYPNLGKIDYTIDIENFGPISRGCINLKPLTIFVGPNNSGKSYAAMLIHSILSFEIQNNMLDGPFGIENQNISRLHDLYDKDIQKTVKQNKGKEFFYIPTTITKKIFASITQDLFGEKLEYAITRNFGSPVNDLIQAKQKSAKISVSNDFDILINKKSSIKMNSKFNTRFEFKISLADMNDTPFVSKEIKNISHVTTINKEFVSEFFESEITSHIIRSIYQHIKCNIIQMNSCYFPATRSSLLQSYKTLSAGLIQNTEFGGIESFQTPKLTGMLSDFISNIMLISNKPGPFYHLAEQLESELFHGNIKLTSTKHTLPEFIYHSKNNKIPLHQTSSIISEIAPFSIYLKHIIKHNSLLIIEEPEAHLHPANQLIFAKYIVKMIRSGLRVLITTHSVFLLEQLGHFMLASKIKSETRKKELGFDVGDYLEKDEVSPYVFVKDGEDNHRILPIEINDEDGISQEEFVKVNELLYSESIKLYKHLPNDFK